jgi:hypothetical protein
MQVFINISLGGWFYSKNYARQPTQGISALRTPFLPRSQLLPKTRGNMSHPFTLCRGVSFQKRSKPCCTTGRSFPSTLPWCGAQLLIQAIHYLLCTMHAHLIHASRLCPWYSPPMMKYLGAPCGPSQTPVSVGTKGSHPCARIPTRHMVNGSWVSIDMRTREDIDDFLVPFQVSWMTRFLRHKNNCGIGYYS